MGEVIGFRDAHRLDMAAQMALGRALYKNRLRLLYHLLLIFIGDTDIIWHMHLVPLSCGAESCIASHPDRTA